MEPPRTSAKDFLPVEVPRLQLRRRLVATIIKNHWGSDALTAIAVNRGHIGPMNAIVFEAPIKRRHSHRANTFGDQFANRIIDHCADNARAKTKAISQIRRDIKLPSTYMDLAFSRLTERDNSRIKPVDQSAQGHKIKPPVLRNLQAIIHGRFNHNSFSNSKYLPGPISSASY